MTRSFEELYALVQSLRVRGGPAQRAVEWCDRDKVTGVAREPSGGYEVFIRGRPLVASSSLIRRHLKHDEWADEAMSRFSANRVVLPSDEHYAAVSAFLVEELQRNGIADAPETAFRVVEPLIEMALRGTALSEETVVGLVGELWFLEVALSKASDASRRAACLHAWRGYERSTRDFVFGDSDSVEVKVTRGLHSHHEISSIGQVDPRRGQDGRPSERLWLLSIGLRPSDEGDPEPTTSLPEKVEEILAHLGPADTRGAPRNEIQELFLSLVAKYGSGSGDGYDHDSMRASPAYGEAWQLTFTRAYRMDDEQVQALRRADIEKNRHVAPDSVTFTLQLPDSLPSGDLGANPISAASLASELIE